MIVIIAIKLAGLDRPLFMAIPIVMCHKDNIVMCHKDNIQRRVGHR